MISNTLTARGITAESLHSPKTWKRLSELRATVDKMVGSVFYGEMLRSSRKSPLKGQYGHGGRGEEVFMAQLHQTLAERAGGARGSELNETIYRRMAAAVVRQTESNPGP